LLHTSQRDPNPCARARRYVACVDGRVLVKLGPRMEMGVLLPHDEDGWKMAACGWDFAVWEKTETAEKAGQAETSEKAVQAEKAETTETSAEANILGEKIIEG
jgi:Alpha-amylase C-terminal beta-sheet domain